MPLVKWEWHFGDSTPSVHVSNTITVGKQQWTMQWPQHAPPGARYKLVIDDAPVITSEQDDILHCERVALVEIWGVEKEVQDNLLALWTPPREWLSEGYQACAIKALAQANGDRYIEYNITISVKGYPTLEIGITVKYISRTTWFVTPPRKQSLCGIPSMVAWAEVSLLEDSDSRIQLDTINLPVVDGVASSTPLIEYLMDNPLMRVSRALSKLGTTIKEGEE
jgi:hypothetical protein